MSGLTDSGIEEQLRAEIAILKSSAERIERYLDAVKAQNGPLLAQLRADRRITTPKGNLRDMPRKILFELRRQEGQTSVQISEHLYLVEYGIDPFLFKRRVQVRLNEMGAKGYLQKGQKSGNGYQWFTTKRADNLIGRL